MIMTVIRTDQRFNIGKLIGVNDINQKISLVDMPCRYLIRQLIINEKYAREQKLSWAQQKSIIFDIIKDISKNILFDIRDKDALEYNLVGYSQDKSVAILPLDGDNHVTESFLLDSDENKTNTAITDSNYSGNPFVCFFKMGLITHENVDIFDNGKKVPIWEYIKGENSGRLSETTFGIIISEKRKQMFVIKQSDKETLGYGALTFYFSKKSSSFKSDIQNNIIFKLDQIVKGDGFNEDDIVSMCSMKVGINNDLVDEYQRRSGSSDAFNAIVLAGLRGLLGTGRTLSFNIDFKEEGDQEAKDLFSTVYSSFSSIKGDDIEKLFTEFCMEYENIMGVKVPVNFKRTMVYTFDSPSEPFNDFKNILLAYSWLFNQIDLARNKSGDQR